MFIGIGYDIHRLVPVRELVLGGVTIPSDRGLLGHSDADVLVHAVIDSILGAAGMGDIGEHFPDTDPRYKDISSLKLLAQTKKLIKNKGYTISNIDATVFAEAPRLSPYKDRMRKNISRALECDEARVNIKATTAEGLGAIGRAEGIAAMSIALLVIGDG